MAHCINIKSPEYLALVKQSKLGQRELKARIAAWQEIYNTDKFPSIEQVEGLLDLQVSSKQAPIDTNKFLKDQLPNYDSNSLSEALTAIKENKQVEELGQLRKDLDSLYNGSSMQTSYVNSFISAFNTLTSQVEKMEIFNALATKGKNFFETLSELYEDYISYPEGFKDFHSLTSKVFNRMFQIGQALNNHGSIIKEHLKHSDTVNNKYNNDLRAYKEVNGRIEVSHKNKTPKQIQGAINHAVNLLKREFSDKVQVKVSQPKNNKNGVSTFVYVEKPNKVFYEQDLTKYKLTQKDMEYLASNMNKYFNNKSITTAKEVMTNISNSDSRYAPLATQLLTKLKEDIPIVVDVNSSYLPGNSRGAYTPSTKSITLALSGTRPSTILHEVIHGLTVDYLQEFKDSKQVKVLENMMKQVKRDLGDKHTTPFTTIEEFVTHTLTNDEFIKDFKNIKREDNEGSFFKQVINTILEFLGFPTGTTTYNDAYSIITDIINDNYEYIGSYSEYEGVDNFDEKVEKLNEAFTDYHQPVEVVNSDYTQALKRLNSKFTLQDIKDFSSTIAQEFAATVSWYHEASPLTTREEFIDELTPARVFQDIKEQFELDLQDYIDNNEDERYITNMQKVVDNFEDLALMATTEINFLEGLKFSFDDFKTSKYDLADELDSGESSVFNIKEALDFGEENIKDGWQVNYKHTSVANSLTNKVKRALSDINELDSSGNPVRNSLGYARKMSMDVIKNDLLKGLQTMITSKDLLPTLGVMSKSKPWITSIIKALEEDNELMSQFYSVFKKDFTKHSIVNTVENNDGSIGYKTITINQSDEINLWIEDWKNTIENRHIYDKRYSIYDSHGDLNINNINNNIEILQSLQNEWQAITKQRDLNLRKDFIKRKNVTIKEQLNAIGIGLSAEDVLNMVNDAFVDTQEVKQLFGIDQSSFRLDTILNKVLLTNIWAKNNIGKEGINNLSLINENRSNYTTIATLSSEALEDLIEGSVHENGKSYYTYLQPSYLSKITKQLKNVSGNNKAFEDFIKEEFKQYEGTIYNPQDDSFNIAWLNDLVDPKTGASKRNLLEHKVVLNFNKTDYSALSPADYQNMLLVEYFSPSVNSTGTDKPKAWYHVPILAEAPSAEFIQFDRIITNYKNNIADSLINNLFAYEYNRIKMVRARKEGIKDGSIQAIKNFDDNGDKFHFLTFLNDHLDIIDKVVSKQGEFSDVTPTELYDFLKEVIIENLDKKADEAIKSLESLGLLETVNGKYKYLSGLNINENNVTDKLHEYFYNSYFATANIIQLTSTDLSFYKNVEDFQKRNKEIHAPGTMVNTQAKYKGERIGKDRETYIILKDQELNSTEEVYNYIKEVLDNNPLLSKIDKESILSKYKNKDGANNITDAQAYRSLDSARSVIAMSTGWNDKLEDSYQRLKSGTWDMKDYTNIMQAFKPFVYTQTTVDSGVLVDPNDPSKGNRMIKVPTQHKNSEAILLPMMGMQFNSPKLRGLMQAMNTNNIDVVMFESAVKVGLQGVLDINNMEDRKQIVDYISSFRDNNQVFKTISYEDYKIQQPIPEHLQDTSQLFGTQLRKLMIADIPIGTTYNVRGVPLDKKQMLNLYNSLIIENTLESYNGLLQEFSSPKELQKIIENELISNTRYSRDLLNAAQLGSDGNFVLPLFDPSQSDRIQQLLNSIWKSRVTKQKIKGGKAVQVSSFGLSDSLELKFHMVNGKPAIEYMECYLPFWGGNDNVPANWESAGFIDPNTGIMDVNKMLNAGIIDEEFLEGISYRIPTEDAYSVWPIKVKGFLPRNSGGNIILPREITTITGSDFDIDSMYLMLKEFKFNEKTGKFTTITPDMNKDPKDMSLKERNNLLIDILRSILSNPNTASKQLNPGNFDGPKMTARRLNILASGANYTWDQLSNMSLKELDKISSKDSLDILDFTTQVALHKQNMTAAKLIGIIANHSTNHAVRQNTNIVVDKIHRAIKYDQTKYDLTSYEGYVELKDRQTGKVKKIDTSIDRFRLNNKFLTSLHEIENPDKTAYISKNYASFLAASVDAVKDPVLSFFNLNTFTADSAMLLTGLGYSFDEIGLLLRQPIIEELINYYDRNSKKGMTKDQAIQNLLYKNKTYLTETLKTPVKSWSSVDNSFSASKMAEMISIGAKLKQVKQLSKEERDSFINSNHDKVKEFYNYQYEVLLNYANILKTSSNLADFVGAAKADTGNGGAGPTIADTKFKLRRIEKHKENSSTKNQDPILKNADVIDFLPKESLTNIDELRTRLRESPMGFIQGFTTLGLQATSEVLSKYFPHYSSYFDYIFNTMEDKYLKSGKLSVEMMNQLYGEFFTYYMSQFEDFNRDNADRFVNKFPGEFLKFKTENEELNNLQLIKNIQYINPGVDVPVAKLKFRAGGKLSSTVRDTIIMEWESLLYQPKYRQLAMDLFKYNYYVNGFNFGATSFIHLAPTALKLEIPNFTSNLNKLMDDNIEGKGSIFSEDHLKTFIDQYYRNHLGNKKLVPVIDTIDSKLFLDVNNNIKESLELKVSSVEHSDLFTVNNGVVPYIGMLINGFTQYYKTTTRPSESKNAVYVTFDKINPLGIRNNFLEYDFGNSELGTIIRSQEEGEVSSREEYQREEADVTKPQDANNYDRSPESFGMIDSEYEDAPDFSDAFNSLVEEVGRDMIEQAKNKCK